MKDLFKHLRIFFGVALLFYFITLLTVIFKEKSINILLTGKFLCDLFKILFVFLIFFIVYFICQLISVGITKKWFYPTFLAFFPFIDFAYEYDKKDVIFTFIFSVMIIAVSVFLYAVGVNI